MFEAVDKGNPCRKEYIDSLESALGDLRRAARVRREAYYRENLPHNADAIRAQLVQKLGWPLTRGEREIFDVRKEFAGARGNVGIYRLQYTLIGGIRFYGMLFVTEDGRKRPLIIAQHGGLGTPEVVGGLLESGTDNYHHMVERLNALGANVFAPQLLIWDPRRFRAREEDAAGDVDLMRRTLDTRLQQVGSSMTAIEIHCIRCAIDHLSAEKFSAPGRVGMMGLSYGGFYTMYTAALEKRINASLTSCSFNDRERRTATDHIWGDSGNWFLDAEIALLICPRALRIQVAARDQILPIDGAQREFERFKALNSELIGRDDWYVFDVFDGRHEFCPDDECLEWLIERS